jgi:hypothetical protein
MVVPLDYCDDHIHAWSCRHNYLDRNPTCKDACGLPLLRMTLKRNDNELRMMKWGDERCMEIVRARNGSGLSGENECRLSASRVSEQAQRRGRRDEQRSVGQCCQQTSR